MLEGGASTLLVICLALPAETPGKLTHATRALTLAAASHRRRGPDGWTVAVAQLAMEESPGSTGIRCRSTAGGGDPRDSATENKPPARDPRPRGRRRARVKRCGKSAPRSWQQERQGKPHREQDRIGAAGGRNDLPGPRGHSRPVARVGRARRAAMRVPEEWPSRVSPPRRRGADRTRLTGRLASSPACTRRGPGNAESASGSA